MNTLRTRGFTLVEVLISMVILAIGLLGAASMMTDSLRLNSEARYRAEAAQLATNVIAALRMDRDNIDKFVALGTVDSLASMRTSTCPETGTDATNRINTRAELLTCWVHKIDATLPGAFATLSANANTAYVDLTIAWLDREPGDYGDVTGRRLANNKTECESHNVAGRASRIWSRSLADKDTESCLIQQRWTVRP